jgi:hypothetical protein
MSKDITFVFFLYKSPHSAYLKFVTSPVLFSTTLKCSSPLTTIFVLISTVQIFYQRLFPQIEIFIHLFKFVATHSQNNIYSQLICFFLIFDNSENFFI